MGLFALYEVCVLPVRFQLERGETFEMLAFSSVQHLSLLDWKATADFYSLSVDSQLFRVNLLPVWPKLESFRVWSISSQFQQWMCLNLFVCIDFPGHWIALKRNPLKSNDNHFWLFQPTPFQSNLLDLNILNNTSRDEENHF
jgi:hypothetical protein